MSAGQMQNAPIGSLIEKVASWNPVRDAPENQLDYIDLSAVDNTSKSVTDWQSMAGREAPSRARQRVKAGDILVSTVRPNLNGVARVPANLDGATASTGFCVLRPKTVKLDASYLFHWVRSSAFVDDMVRKATGASYPAVSDKIIGQSEIPLPPLDEQKRIAAILDQADELRRKRQRALDRLNQLGQAIFHEMFGDSTSNPKGWKEDSLGSIVRKGDKINYGVVQPGDDVEDGVPLIRVGDLLKPFIDPSKTKRISTEVEANYKRSRLAGDEILIGCVGSIGTVALAHAGLKGANIARAVARVPVNSELAEREFVAEMIRSPLVQRYFAAETRTVAQPTLNISLIVSAPIFVPPLQLQKEFVARISALRSALAGNGKSSVSLDELFSSLQHRAFRGEL